MIYIVAEDGCYILQEGDPINGRILAEADNADGLSPTNDTATIDSKNRFNVCQLSGMKVKPGELREQWDGTLVRPESFSKRSEQDFVRTHAERLPGAVRPEQADTFIDVAVDPDDL